MSTVYYNEIEPYAADWIDSLAKAALIAPATVDRRSIVEVQPADVATFTRCHFFAGIAGWEYALQLAGWPTAAPVWTGSCPCQPFSDAGERRGTADARHLWPEWFRLIRKQRPSILFGEQVASGAALSWIDAIQTDLEGEGYTFGAADLCAASVGAPHGRQRLYFVAYTDEQRLKEQHTLLRREENGCASHNLSEIARRGAASAMANTGSVAGSKGHRSLDCAETSTQRKVQNERLRPIFGAGGPCASPWANIEWIACTDGKTRPVEPGTFPLVDGVPARVGRLRACGNAIVPQVAAVFIRIVMDYLEL